MTPENNMNQTPLDPVIREVAEAYGFEIVYCDMLDRWQIRHDEENCCFYWASRYTKQCFFEMLREYFKEIGAQTFY